MVLLVIACLLQCLSAALSPLSVERDHLRVPQVQIIIWVVQDSQHCSEINMAAACWNLLAYLLDRLVIGYLLETSVLATESVCLLPAESRPL